MNKRINPMKSDTASLPASQFDLVGGSSAPEQLPQPWFARNAARGANYLLKVLNRIWAQASQVRVRQNKKRLRVCETVSLGDKRFVAVIQVDDKQFLLGGAPNSVSLIAQLDKPAEFSAVLQNRISGVSASA
jgi:hypothetical protein